MPTSKPTTDPPPPPPHAHIQQYTWRSCAICAQNGSQRWDDGRTPDEALKDLGVSRLSPQDAARLHSDLRAAQVSVVASRMKWAALLKETDTVSELGDARGDQSRPSCRVPYLPVARSGERRLVCGGGTGAAAAEKWRGWGEYVGVPTFWVLQGLSSNGGAGTAGLDGNFEQFGASLACGNTRCTKKPKDRGNGALVCSYVAA